MRLRASCSISRASVVSHSAGHLALLLGEQDLERGAAGAQLLARRAVLLQAAETDAQHAHGPVGALGVAAEPEQVVGGAARQVLRRALDAGGLACVGRHRLVKGGGTASLTTHTSRDSPSGALSATVVVGIDGHGQAARHDGKAAAGGGHEQAQRVGLGHEPGGRQRWRGAEADLLLGDQRGAPDLDLLQQPARARSASRRAGSMPGMARPGRAVPSCAGRITMLSRLART